MIRFWKTVSRIELLALAFGCALITQGHFRWFLKARLVVIQLLITSYLARSAPLGAQLCMDMHSNHNRACRSLFPTI